MDTDIDMNSPHIQQAKRLLQARLEVIETEVCKLALTDDLVGDKKLAAKWGKEFYLPAVQALATCDVDEIRAALSQAIKAVAILSVWLPAEAGVDGPILLAIADHREKFGKLIKGQS
jgi:hypothetical protein